MKNKVNTVMIKGEEVDYGNMVSNLAKDGDDILQSMNGSQAHLLHMGVGVVGEAGELIDAVKKFVIYQKDLDRENVVEELGDLEFYMQGLRDELSITREETLQANADKLGKRYSGGTYSDLDAQTRADKQNNEGDLVDNITPEKRGL